MNYNKKQMEIKNKGERNHEIFFSRNKRIHKYKEISGKTRIKFTISHM